METFARMKSQFIKVSWGIVEIGSAKVYCELWLSTGMMNQKVKFKVPKGMSVSYTCSAKDAPFEDGSFLSYWIPKNVQGATVNELVETVVERLQLKFFEEPRKYLTKVEVVALLLSRTKISLMDRLSPNAMRAKISTLKNVDDSILWKYVDGSKQWCEWIVDPMNPENVRQRILEAYGVYQVYLDLDGDCEYHITEWDPDGIQDYPWAIYVGTRSECEAFIRYRPALDRR